MCFSEGETNNNKPRTRQLFRYAYYQNFSSEGLHSAVKANSKFGSKVKISHLARHFFQLFIDVLIDFY